MEYYQNNQLLRRISSDSTKRTQKNNPVHESANRVVKDLISYCFPSYKLSMKNEGQPSPSECRDRNSAEARQVYQCGGDWEQQETYTE